MPLVLFSFHPLTILSSMQYSKRKRCDFSLIYYYQHKNKFRKTSVCGAETTNMKYSKTCRFPISREVSATSHIVQIRKKKFMRAVMHKSRTWILLQIIREICASFNFRHPIKVRSRTNLSLVKQLFGLKEE